MSLRKTLERLVLAGGLYLGSHKALGTELIPTPEPTPEEAPLVIPSNELKLDEQKPLVIPDNDVGLFRSFYNTFLRDVKKNFDIEFGNLGWLNYSGGRLALEGRPYSNLDLKLIWPSGFIFGVQSLVEYNPKYGPAAVVKRYNWEDDAFYMGYSSVRENVHIQKLIALTQASGKRIDNPPIHDWNTSTIEFKYVRESQDKEIYASTFLGSSRNDNWDYIFDNYGFVEKKYSSEDSSMLGFGSGIKSRFARENDIIIELNRSLVLTLISSECRKPDPTNTYLKAQSDGNYKYVTLDSGLSLRCLRKGFGLQASVSNRQVIGKHHPFNFRKPGTELKFGFVYKR